MAWRRRHRNRRMPECCLYSFSNTWLPNFSVWPFSPVRLARQTGCMFGPRFALDIGQVEIAERVVRILR